MLIFPFSLTVEYRTPFLLGAGAAWSLLAIIIVATMLLVA
jgi:hypothetical protein